MQPRGTVALDGAIFELGQTFQLKRSPSEASAETKSIHGWLLVERSVIQTMALAAVSASPSMQFTAGHRTHPR